MTTPIEAGPLEASVRQGGFSMEGRADWNTFRDNIKALSFMPGQWRTFDMSEEYVCWPMYDKFCIHFSAPEPVVAEFEVALDNML